MTLNFDPEFILKDEVVEKLQALGFSKPAQMVIYDENGNIITDIEGGLPPEDTWEVMIEDFPESTTDDFFSVPEYGEDDEIIEDFDIAEPEDEIIEE